MKQCKVTYREDCKNIFVLLIEFFRTTNCCMVFDSLPVANFYIVFLYYSLYQLTQLEILDIQWNHLHTVPDVVSFLTSLKQLNMWRCGISNLPVRFVCHMFITTSQHNYYYSVTYIYTQLIIYRI